MKGYWLTLCITHEAQESSLLIELSNNMKKVELIIKAVCFGSMVNSLFTIDINTIPLLC